MRFDYKKIIKSREVRLKILRICSFIPDKLMIKIQYYLSTGRKLNINTPKRFTEKLQWYKLYYRNPLMIQCVDKGDARTFVELKGLKDILIPCYGIYDDVEDISWETLPKQFVVKDTLGGGGNSVYIVKNKEATDVKEVKKMMQGWLEEETGKKTGGREWPYYSGKPHRVLIEKYLESSESEGGLIDYKFFCFSGKVKFLYVIADRKMGCNAGLGIFDAEFNLLPVERADEEPLKRVVDKPENFDKMKEIAELLSQDFPEVRVDLYCHESRIYFGEMTFFDGSGYMSFEPDEFDFTAGSYFMLE